MPPFNLPFVLQKSIHKFSITKSILNTKTCKNINCKIWIHACLIGENFTAGIEMGQEKRKSLWIEMTFWCLWILPVDAINYESHKRLFVSFVQFLEREFVKLWKQMMLVMGKLFWEVFLWFCFSYLRDGMWLRTKIQF